VPSQQFPLTRAGTEKRQRQGSRILTQAVADVTSVHADTIRQERLRALDHAQAMERLRLESGLKAADAATANGLFDRRASFDRLLDVTIKALERKLGLGDQAVDDEQLAAYVREAMEQAGNFD